MKGVMLLSTRHLQANPALTTILVLCLAITLFVPVATSLLTARYERSLVARSDATPLVVGAKGSRFDLVLGALYFRQSEIDPVKHALYEELRTNDELLVIPLHVGYTAQAQPVVGTTLDYLDWRGLRTERGRRPAAVGEAVLGARAAERLGVALDGDTTIFSDQPELYDIARPPAVKLRVVGVLAATGTPDDDAVFVDIKTTWLLGGFLHGHREVTTIDDPDMLIGRTDEHVAVSGALIENNEVTGDNVESFHMHGDPSQLPLTAVIVDPATAKAGTMAKAQINVAGAAQMVEPRLIVDELLEFVFRIKAALDALAAVLAVCTALLGILVLVLSLRLRAGEIATLQRMGCGRNTVFMLCASEVGMIVALSLLLAAVGVAAAVQLAPEFIRYL